MATRQVSVTIDEDLLAFVDQHSQNRSAAITEALRLWQDRLWQQQMEAEFSRLTALNSPDELAVAQEASQLSTWTLDATDA
jgi:metal-responsive CopG/Arc/MetJ family transcriptional regulator